MKCRQILTLAFRLTEGRLCQKKPAHVVITSRYVRWARNAEYMGKREIYSIFDWLI
jgi:hypothetical protein